MAKEFFSEILCCGLNTALGSKLSTVRGSGQWFLYYALQGLPLYSLPVITDKTFGMKIFAISLKVS